MGATKAEVRSFLGLRTLLTTKNNENVAKEKGGRKRTRRRACKNRRGRPPLFETLYNY